MRELALSFGLRHSPSKTGVTALMAPSGPLEHMVTATDIVIFGTGSFAARIVCDMAATGAQPTSVLIAGRNADRLAWLATAANARASMFGRPLRFSPYQVDLAVDGAAAEVIAQAQPAVVVQAASLQASAVISSEGNAWTRLVAEGGLSATAVLQAPLSVAVARAISKVRPDCRLVNCCFADVVNPLIAALGLPVTCGVGNVAILANAFAGALAQECRLKVLAHYQHLAAWRRPPVARAGETARVWIDDNEITDVFARFASVRLSREPAIEISGASGVPLILALAHGHDWQGHVPGPHGLPGGYPVAVRQGAVVLDLPPSLSRADAIAWNARREEDSGLVVGSDGRARYTGVLRDRLAALAPELADGFVVADLAAVYRTMNALKQRLEQQAG
jgi:hypothetical protein